MHGIAHVAGSFDIINLLSTFCGAHFYYSLDKGQRGCLFLLGGMDAKEIHDLDLCVVAIGRQEMDV